jgi:putative copper export protein
MALWRLSEVLFGSDTVGEPQPDKRKAVTHRLTAVGKVVLYGVLGYSVLEYALGTGGTQSSDTESVDATAKLLQHTGGQVLVAVIGAVLVVTGVVLAYQAWREKFLEAMDLSGLPGKGQRAVAWLGRAGGIARGVVIVTAGVFLFVAAVNVQPGQAKGVDSALRSLAGTPAGPWLLAVVALGLIMFGVFSGCEARWRKV